MRSWFRKVRLRSSRAPDGRRARLHEIVFAAEGAKSWRQPGPNPTSTKRSRWEAISERGKGGGG